MTDEQRLEAKCYFYGIVGEFAKQIGRLSRLLEFSECQKTREEIVFEIDGALYDICQLCQQAEIPIIDEDFEIWDLKDSRGVKNTYSSVRILPDKVDELMAKVRRERHSIKVGEERKFNDILKFGNGGNIGKSIEQCQREYDKRLRKINEGRRKDPS